MRPESDVDSLADFPDENVAEAIWADEDAREDLGLRYDILDLATCAPGFLRRVPPRSWVIEWLTVEDDFRSARDHFFDAARLFEARGFDVPGLEGYAASTAFTQAVQSGHALHGTTSTPIPPRRSFSGRTEAGVSVSHPGSRIAPRHQSQDADHGPGQTRMRAIRTTVRTASLPETVIGYDMLQRGNGLYCSLRVRVPGGRVRDSHGTTY